MNTSELQAGFVVPLIFLAFAATYFGILYLVERILKQKRERRAAAEQQVNNEEHP